MSSVIECKKKEELIAKLSVNPNPPEKAVQGDGQ